MAVAIQRMSPQLPVADLERALAFYTTQLSFDVEFRYQDFYAGILRDGHSIHLKCCARAPEEIERRRRGECLDLTFSVDDIEPLWSDLQARDVTVTQPLRDMPYGREVHVADPDGNVLAFLQPAS